MNTKQILVAGDQSTLTDAISRELGTQPGWTVSTAGSAEEGIEMIHRQPADILILAFGEDASSRKMATIANWQMPGIIILQSDASQTHLLTGMINNRLQEQQRIRRKSLVFSDDVFSGFHAAE